MRLCPLMSSTRRFQFTPLREGLRKYTRYSPYVFSHFNSRPCERGFHLEPLYYRAGTAISIHAPARGASFPFTLYRKPVLFQFTPLREGLQQKAPIFLSVFYCFLFIKYIFTKLIFSNPQFNQYRPYICAIFIAPISWDFMYGKYMRKVL